MAALSLANLDGNNGFRLDGVSHGDASGTSVSNAGDVNGDGFADVIIGNDGGPWADYVVFGQASGFDAAMNLSSLNGSNGFRLDGVSAGGNLGRSSVSNAGDVNGDGFDDVIVIGAPDSVTSVVSNFSHVMFGKASGFDAAVDVSGLDGKNGFSLVVTENSDSVHVHSVSNAGDVNGDGFADVIVGSLENVSYVIFGQASGFAATMDLSSLDGNNGFRLDGEGGHFGRVVSSAGDVNGDGFEDVIVGAPFANPNGNYYPAGSSYVVFGRATGFDAAMNVSSLDGNNGFRLDGEDLYSEFGESVSSAGDVNGDGFDDVIIGTQGALSYVVFGKVSGFDEAIGLSSLDGSDGFRIVGGGESVSSAGDVNGDGFGDLIVGAPDAGSSGRHEGFSYVVFGKASGFDAHIDLANLDNQGGFRLDGENNSDNSGASVSGAGDVNGDGFDDLLVGAWRASPNGEESAGSSYVIFGGLDIVSGGLPGIFGTSMDDHLQGTLAAEHFDAGDGDDVLLGGGGADQFIAGAGNDIISVPDLDFAFLEGGTGQDSLQLLGNRLNLDLTQSSNIKDIETIDLGEKRDNKLVLTADKLRDLSESTNTIKVQGDSSAHVAVLDTGWYDFGDDTDYHTYIHNGTKLQVESDVSIDFATQAKPVFDLSSLNGSNGFRLDGENEFDGSGASVSSVGDVNGDGFDDVIIGTNFYSSVFPNNEYELSSSYVVFGKATGFDAQVDLSSLDGSNGFRLDRAATKDSARFSVSGAGDVNGDGFDDVIAGVLRPDFSGEQYIVFGKASGFDAHIDLSSMDGSNGFRLDGGSEFDLIGLDGLGMPVDNAGDINGDGFDDVIARADKTNSVFGVGSNFVIFGKGSGFDATLPLSSLDGSNGFQIEGDSLNDGAAFLVNSAGDVNGDDFDDLIIGSANVNLNPDFPGSNYVVFGKASGFDAQLDLSNLDGSNGFRVDGENAADTHGYSVSSAGDINGDGFDDVVIGASRVNQDGQPIDSNYVIFGKASGFDVHINLSDLNGSNGFRLDGNANLGYSNFSASSAGDVNGDGFDDLIVGSSASGTLRTFSGPSFVVFGKASGFDAQIDLTSLEDKNVLRLHGRMDESDSFSSFSVSAAGDINSDGFDDLIVGDPNVNSSGERAGSSYVIFGSRDFGGGQLPTIPGTPGDDVLRGTSAAEIFEAGDGNDLLIGRGGADVFHGGAGVDQIKVPDLNFESIDGGSGNDILHLDGKDLHLDLTAFGDKIHGIETICLYGRGDNTLALTTESLRNLSDTSNTLKLHGNAGDRVTVQDNGWIDGGVKGFYHTYTNDDAVLLVGANLMIDFV